MPAEQGIPVLAPGWPHKPKRVTGNNAQKLTIDPPKGADIGSPCSCNHRPCSRATIWEIVQVLLAFGLVALFIARVLWTLSHFYEPGRLGKHESSVSSVYLLNMAGTVAIIGCKCST